MIQTWKADTQRCHICCDTDIHSRCFDGLIATVHTLLILQIFIGIAQPMILMLYGDTDSIAMYDTFIQATRKIHCILRSVIQMISVSHSASASISSNDVSLPCLYHRLVS